MNEKLTGSCHCGKIKYRIEGKNFDADYCHCQSCQKITGAPISAWMDFKINQVEWLSAMPKEYKSSASIRRGFCENCGSTLTYRHINHPEYTTLAISSLDDPNLVHPTYHVHTKNQMTWLKINDDYKRYHEGRK